MHPSKRTKSNISIEFKEKQIKKNSVQQTSFLEEKCLFSELFKIKSQD